MSCWMDQGDRLEPWESAKVQRVWNAAHELLTQSSDQTSQVASDGYFTWLRDVQFKGWNQPLYSQYTPFEISSNPANHSWSTISINLSFCFPHCSPGSGALWLVPTCLFKGPRRRLEGFGTLSARDHHVIGLATTLLRWVNSHPKYGWKWWEFGLETLSTQNKRLEFGPECGKRSQTFEYLEIRWRPEAWPYLWKALLWISGCSSWNPDTKNVVPQHATNNEQNSVCCNRTSYPKPRTDIDRCVSHLELVGHQTFQSNGSWI